ncbi:MAG: hypothetical protein JXX14_22810 [Deltaproteobacteria bacterium]|nr:hypothetical protein [Deltaproteobacteria bacterium]
MRPHIFHVVALLLLGGCGYRPLLTTGQNAPRHIHIKTIENQTATGNVTVPLMLALRSQLNQFGFCVQPKSTGTDDVLIVRVFSVRAGTDALKLHNGTEHSVRRKWEMRAMVSLKTPERARAFGPEVITVEESTDEAQSVSAAAVIDTHTTQHLAEGLAHRIVLRIAAGGRRLQ